ncbi:Glucan 1,3-beta-glucosidase [Roseomonas mucosa]|uniref:Endo-1,3-beta-glucanase btgC n=1 Tax=Roseomonas mucosa TaxID=207340 RepID=A0A379N4N6_9PROT|nr:MULTISPECIES: glycoside hydrolase [Roseomonas]AWV23770.1 Glucan 1,3-beta-glucosidase [Roseomonas mucosa]MCG7353495.1 glycoside hydrolase [Roseomonas mucosa]MCG7358841.1 glycoside hydrolase [Roseomonas mucosa]MDT8291968.1 glycoside hydrolase [Roseomonas mucosa]MDT8293839.1 glycoside hydrolase [Roseomonas mucosa]
MRRANGFTPRPASRGTSPGTAPGWGLPAVLLLGLLATLLAWWWPNRAQLGDLPMPAERLNSVSFAPFRTGDSPLRGIFPSAAEVEEDMRLIAPRVRGIRTYASVEGDYDVAAIAARNGLKLWQGAWLSGTLANNEREVARLIESANRHPETVERVVVGNEVLLRRDLPPAALIGYLDRVRAAVRQPVTYADVWEFWQQFPEVARHVDIVTIHILPYWEDEPLDVEAAIAHTRDIVHRMRALFPGKPIAIGEVGWPSAGRWREGAVPSTVSQARFLREFAALSREEGFDYNVIEAFDQVWKYKSEGTVGAAWGLWTADRQPKFALSGPVRENALWGWYAGAAALLGLGLLAATARAFPAAPRAPLALLALALGNALAFAWCGGVPYAFDEHLMLAVTANLAGQALLAALLLRRAGQVLSGLPVEMPRTGAQATASVRALLRGRLRWRDWRGFAFDDLSFVFLWTAMVLQLLLLFDPRYRDFPFPTFAVPLVAVVARALLRDLPLRGGGWAEAWAGGTLALAALASAWREGPENLQALGWTACALGLAAPALLRLRRRAEATGKALRPARATAE